MLRLFDIYLSTVLPMIALVANKIQPIGSLANTSLDGTCLFSNYLWCLAQLLSDIAKMTVYNIRFENQSGASQKYAFFSSAPRIASNADTSKIYSNVFMSQNVSNNSTWTFSVNTQYYAWCGIAPEKLGNGIKVSGSGKPVNLGAPSAPGTTWAMYNNHSSPALKSPTTTAGHGAFEIDTANDFHPRMDFVLGVGGVDATNRIRPFNTLEAPRNARINLAPVARYFLTATELGVGTAVDPCLLARSAASIDFGSHPGMYGAVVRRLASGAYSVQYTSGSV